MGVPVLIMGDSGSGKSFAMHSLDPCQAAVFNCLGKQFPFSRRLHRIDLADIFTIFDVLSEPLFPVYAVDDSQILPMNADGTFSPEKAEDLCNLIGFIKYGVPDEVFVYFNFTLPGCREKFPPEYLFPIVFMSVCRENEHFAVNCKCRINGRGIALPRVTANDLAQTDTTLRKCLSV